MEIRREVAPLVPPPVQSRHLTATSTLDYKHLALHCNGCELQCLPQAAQLNCWPPNRAEDANESGAEQRGASKVEADTEGKIQKSVVK